MNFGRKDFSNVRQDQLWTAVQLQTNWNLFKSRHLELYQWDYYLSNDVVYVTKDKITTKLAGYVFDLGSWPYEMLESHLLNVLRDEEEKYRKKRQMADQTKERLQEAEEKGTAWARYGLALNPNMPLDVVQDFAIDLAQLLGYPDTKATMAFVKPIMAAFRKHQEDNTDYLDKAINLAKKQHMLKQGRDISLPVDESGVELTTD